MKKLGILIAASVMAMSAQADFIVAVASAYGINDNNQTAFNPLLPNIGDEALIQLIYAGTDNVISGKAGVGGSTAGDDSVIGSWIFTNTGGTDAEKYATFSYDHTSAYQGDGYVYCRVFDTATAPVNSWYAEGHLQQLSDLDPSGTPAPTPDVYNMGQGADIWAHNPVVPEPATIGMMGVAGLGMFLARKKNRR